MPETPSQLRAPKHLVSKVLGAVARGIPDLWNRRTIIIQIRRQGNDLKVDLLTRVDNGRDGA